MIGPGEATRQGSTEGKEAGNGIPGAPRGPYLLLSRGTFGYSSSRADVSRFSCEVNGRGVSGGVKAKQLEYYDVCHTE